MYVLAKSLQERRERAYLFVIRDTNQKRKQNTDFAFETINLKDQKHWVRTEQTWNVMMIMKNTVSSFSVIARMNVNAKPMK